MGWWSITNRIIFGEYYGGTSNKAGNTQQGGLYWLFKTGAVNASTLGKSAQKRWKYKFGLKRKIQKWVGDVSRRENNTSILMSECPPPNLDEAMTLVLNALNHDQSEFGIETRDGWVNFSPSWVLNPSVRSALYGPGSICLDPDDLYQLYKRFWDRTTVARPKMRGALRLVFVFLRVGDFLWESTPEDSIDDWAILPPVQNLIPAFASPTIVTGLQVVLPSIEPMSLLVADIEGL